MKILGQVFLWLGFLSGALATVYCPPKKAVEFTKDLSAKEQQRLEAVAAADPLSDDKAGEKLKPPGYAIPDLKDVELPVDDWSQIPWLWYGLSAMVCFGGVVMIQVNKKSSVETENKKLASLDELKGKLMASIKATGAIHKAIETLPPSKIVERIDSELSPLLHEFAENRDRLTAEFDLSVFADVMTNFAAGERAVNRAWSAAADGYLDEVSDCLTRATDMLSSALATIER